MATDPRLTAIAARVRAERVCSKVYIRAGRVWERDVVLGPFVYDRMVFDDWPCGSVTGTWVPFRWSDA